MAEIKRLPKRSEVKVEDTWNLADIFESDEKWFAALEELAPYGERLLAYKGRLGESAERLLGFYKLSDEFALKAEALAEYAFRKSDEDTSEGKYVDMRGRFMASYVQLMSVCAFSSPEIMAIPEETLEGFYASLPELALYKRAIDVIRRKKAHILSEAEEKLLAAASEMSSAPSNIGSAFRNADLKFPDVADKDGVMHPLSSGTYIPLVMSDDRVLRENAFNTLYNTYYSYRNTAAALLDAQMKQLKFFANARNYENTLQAALDETEVPTSVYHGLIEAVHGRMDLMYKYMELRRRLMGLDKLHLYDIYTPIVAEANEVISYKKAQEIVLEALKPLGENYVSLLKEGFENRWIDVYENEGKRGGAYSAGARPHPYVLLNHTDDLESMFTLAHEMGHALHSYHSNHAQPTVYSDYVIFVAEVASTCNEVLLMKHLLAGTDDKVKKAYLINHFLEQFRTTLYRQTMFAEFELMMNEMCERGEALTADALCEKYLALNKLYYGDDIVVDEGIAMEWARIPHFFMNYYVFQYSTGFSAAVAIANRILTEGEEAVKDYIKFLSGGCSEDPISLLKIAGVDMTTGKPVSDALDLFSDLLCQMEELMKEEK